MTNEEKREVVRDLILDGGVVRIVFNVQVADVVIPDNYLNQLRLALDFGLNGVEALTDLEVGDDAISATLRFKGDYIWCSIPWEAVIGVIPHGESKPLQTNAWKPELLKGGLN